MRFPGLHFFFRQRLGEVARAVAQQQFVEALVLETHALAGQCRGFLHADRFQLAPVILADEPAIQIFIHIDRRAGCRLLQHLRPDGAQVGAGSGQRGVRAALVEIDIPARGQFGLQRLEIGHQHRRLVQVHALDRQARDAFRQVVGAREHARADRLGIEGEQFGRIVAAIPDQDFILVGRVLRQRIDEGQAAVLDREHAGHVQERLARFRGLVQADLGGDAVLAAQLQAKVEQARLLAADQARQRDGRAHVRQRIVRGLVRQAVGRAQVLQLEARLAIVAGGPHDAVRAQRMHHAHDVEQVPAAAVVLPLARVRIDQVAPEQVARDFVVEADRVVADADRVGLAECGLDLARELVLGHAVFEAVLRQDAGDQARFRIGQKIIGRLAVQHDRLADLVEFSVGADRGELGRAVAARGRAKGFVVVPEEGMRAHVLLLSWLQSQRRRHGGTDAPSRHGPVSRSVRDDIGR